MNYFVIQIHNTSFVGRTSCLQLATRMSAGIMRMTVIWRETEGWQTADLERDRESCRLEADGGR